MSVIRTKEFTFSRLTLFRLFLLAPFARQGLRLLLAYSLVLLSIPFLAFSNNKPLVVLLPPVTVTLFVFLYFFSLWRTLDPKKQRAFYERRFHEIDGEFFTTTAADGSISKFPLRLITQVRVALGHYVIRLDQNAFLFIPQDQFASNEDRIAFEQMVKFKTQGIGNKKS